MNKFGFDNYSFKARLQPMFIALFPALLAAPIWAPTIYKLGATLMGLFMTCGIMYIFSNLSRTLGLKAQDKLVEEWGGMPTTLSLRHGDDTFDPDTTRRYHDFLEKNVPGWIAPRVKDESRDSSKTDNRYDSAVRWLREYTRDPSKYPLILKENIGYGFRRNSYGLKPIGIAVCLFALTFSGLALWGSDLSYLVKEELPKTIYIIIVSLTLVWWVFAVSKNWVKSGARSYTRALLAACDTNT